MSPRFRLLTSAATGLFMESRYIRILFTIKVSNVAIPSRVSRLCILLSL
jgi:hypothetical protein